MSRLGVLLTEITQIAASSAGTAKKSKSVCVVTGRLMRMPPTSGPRIEPRRPMPKPQPIPVARTADGLVQAVGEESAILVGHDWGSIMPELVEG
jgi:pimeloyl-ACP methyl ester carboxylesterase